MTLIRAREGFGEGMGVPFTGEVSEECGRAERPGRHPEAIGEVSADVHGAPDVRGARMSVAPADVRVARRFTVTES